VSNRKFLKAAEQLEYESVYSANLPDIEADWTENVVMRFARVFMPELTVRDAREKPEKFFGYVAAFVSQLIELAKKVKLSEIPRTKFGKILRREILAIRTVGPGKLRRLKQVAAELPQIPETEFFTAYVESVEKGTVDRALNRLIDSNTAKICFFLLLMIPHIRARRFHSVSELLRVFMQIEELDEDRKKFLKQNEGVRRTLEQQFRDICSEDGLRLRGKGRPKKILPAAA